MKKNTQTFDGFYVLFTFRLHDGNYILKQYVIPIFIRFFKADIVVVHVGGKRCTDVSVMPRLELYARYVLLADLISQYKPNS